MAPVILLLAALAIYAPTLRLGLFSDDFVLVAWARAGDFVPAGWEYVRPVPLILWWGVARIVPAWLLPSALHGVNVLLHGANAGLVHRLALRLRCSPATSFAAGLGFLVFPTAVEAVAWPTAVFDLMLTCLVLWLSLLATGKSIGPATMAVALTLGALALGTKETAVATAPLIALAVWFAGQDRRRGHAIAFGTALLAVGYAMWRWSAGRLTSPPGEIDARLLRILLVDPFIALAYPFHDAVQLAHPLLAATFAAATALGMVGCAMGHHPHRRPGAFATLWVIVAVAPLLGMFSVGTDLEAARYLYLPSCAWMVAIMTGLLNAGSGGHVRRAGAGIAAAMLLVSVLALDVHLGRWHRATRVRDGILDVLLQLPAECDAVFVTAVPDNAEGVPLFRNGLLQALESRGRVFRLTRGSTDVPPDCRLGFAGF